MQCTELLELAKPPQMTRKIATTHKSRKLHQAVDNLLTSSYQILSKTLDFRAHPTSLCYESFDDTVNIFSVTV